MSSDARPEPAEAVASAVLAVPGISALHAGVLGEAATYLPGRRVNGVQIRDDECEVHVVLDWGVPVLETADRVRAAVEELVEGPVHVTVEDIAAPGEPSGPGA
ncbi:MAG: Asp23/Gls24 family envelope stress response protein [Actinomycetales bacterium]|nr:MAG: Asp23/Gls24 family envelope stress response protein [Actinomycetales bacterium]